MFKKINVVNNVYSHIVTYPTPATLNYNWSFGSLLGICLLLQIVTGVILAMFYTPHSDYAFISVERIMRDINNGWLLRYMHSNGASLFFLLVYLHIGRGFYYKVYLNSRAKLAAWYSGCLIFILMMATAFMGYILPWGQMSFWAATVITNLFTAIPVIGDLISTWLWGGFSVSNNTLNRFFSLHFVLPFVIAALVILHIAILHVEGSTTPMGKDSVEYIQFYPYFFLKDLISFFLFLFILCSLIFFAPNMLSDADNYIKSNPLVTPAHIVPEWYFLFFYAILRSIPNKLLGVLYLVISLGILFLIPLIDNGSVQPTVFRPLYQVWFWSFVTNLVVTSWLGAQIVEEPYIWYSKLSILTFFADVFVVLPIINIVENNIYE